jgi:Fe2+ transport system protein FeoA
MVQVQAVNATETGVLQYLQERGILPGCWLTIVEAAPLEGPLMLRVGEQNVALGLQLSEFVIVETPAG